MGEIGLVKVVSEGSVGSNLRRIEAICGNGIVELLRSEQDTIDQLASTLQVPRGDSQGSLEKRLLELAEAQKQVQDLQSQLAMSQATDLAAQAKDGVVIHQVDGIERDQLKELAVAIRDCDGVTAVVLGGAPPQGGAALVAATTAEFSVTAGELIAQGSKSIKGGGGKGDRFAMAGGKEPAGIDQALADAARAAGM